MDNTRIHIHITSAIFGAAVKGIIVRGGALALNPTQDLLRTSHAIALGLAIRALGLDGRRGDTFVQETVFPDASIRADLIGIQSDGIDNAIAVRAGEVHAFARQTPRAAPTFRGGGEGLVMRLQGKIRQKPTVEVVLRGRRAVLAGGGRSHQILFLSPYFFLFEVCVVGRGRLAAGVPRGTPQNPFHLPNKVFFAATECRFSLAQGLIEGVDGGIMAPQFPP
ncbi:unnamed protein product [Phytomonas sp. Hart1]|nr:unnamed protein product [Phytomonas sp. Hart1]|eukprot:CCW67559.1 unnamed protein product [Phytomonas sp. isolate Hart1]